MYQHTITRNRWENQYIDAKCKNKHKKSRNKLPQRSSNSLKQELRNGKFNLQLFDRLYMNRCNKHYSLDKYLQCDNIYDDYNMILNNTYYFDDIHNNNASMDTWQCSRCTYINIQGLSFCKICGNDNDTNSITSSSSCHSEPSITTSSSLSSYIITNKRIKRIKRKKPLKKQCHSSSFRFDDESYKKFKKYMKKRKTSIIAYKKAKNDYKYNSAKNEKRKRDAQKLYQLYRILYLTKTKNKEEITSIIKNMTSFIPKKYLKMCVSSQSSNNTQCKVCYADDEELISMNTYCTHSMICKPCFKQYVEIIIKDNEHILPWILCPEQECKAPIHYDLLLQYVSLDHLYRFGRCFVYKHLQRSSYWRHCPDGYDTKCTFGWVLEDKYDDECIELKCESCGCNDIIKVEEISKHGCNDDGFGDLIAQGIMRECPECNYPAIKDYGMCNVMHCGRCGVYWNWRTKESGSSTNDVKQKARSSGTLWEPGELAYQQNLQRDNLTEFKALLAKNGIKYDPNYRRGT